MRLHVIKSPRQKTIVLFALIFALFLLRYSAFGPVYFPQLDDYIQYHNYRNSFDFLTLCERTGLLETRPLAGIADYFIWAPMFDHMFLSVVVLSALYTGYILCAAGLLKRYFQVGPVFYAVSCFFPLGMEGLYWVSASSRVVMGLFFGVLAAWVFAKWLDTGEWWLLILYLPLQLIPFGFYEQCGILSATFVLGIALLEWKKWRYRVLPALWVLSVMAFYLIYIKAMSSGKYYSSRAGLISVISPYYREVFLPELLKQLYAVLIKGSWLTLVKGARRGLLMAFDVLPWMMLIVLLCVGLTFALCSTKKETDSEEESGVPRFAAPGWNILAGFLLAAAPLSLYFVMDTTIWVTMRGASLSLLGMGLMADGLCRIILCRLVKNWCTPCAMLSGVLTLVFCVACLSELSDYRQTYLDDQWVAQILLDGLADVDPSARVGVLGLEESYLPDQNFYYHGHIVGCIEAEWSTIGLLKAVQAGPHPSVVPLHTPSFYQGWNREVNLPEKFDLLYYYNGSSIELLRLEQIGEHEFMVYYDSGSLMGHIWEEDVNGYFELVSEDHT